MQCKNCSNTLNGNRKMKYSAKVYYHICDHCSCVNKIRVKDNKLENITQEKFNIRAMLDMKEAKKAFSKEFSNIKHIEISNGEKRIIVTKEDSKINKFKKVAKALFPK